MKFKDLTSEVYEYFHNLNVKPKRIFLVFVKILRTSYNINIQIE
jgi:hypothetical protein